MKISLKYWAANFLSIHKLLKLCILNEIQCFLSPFPFHLIIKLSNWSFWWMSVWDNCKQQNCSILWPCSVIRGSLSCKLTAAWHLLLKRIFLKMDSIVRSFIQFSSDQISHSVVSDSLRPHELQHARPLCPSPTPRVHPNSCASSRWCHPAISSSVVPFYSCPQSLPASGSFPMCQLFAWGGQSIGVSASASVLPMNTQDWSPLGWTGWISLQSKGLERVFSLPDVEIKDGSILDHGVQT